MAVLTAARVRRLIDRYLEGASPATLMAEFDVSESTVSRIITGQSWKAVTGGVNRSRGPLSTHTAQLTEYRKNYVQARLDQGCRSKATIGKELGISRQAVVKIIARHGLVIPPRNGK